MLARVLAILTVLAAVPQIAVGGLATVFGGAMLYAGLSQALDGDRSVPYKPYLGAAAISLAMGAYLLLPGLSQLAIALHALAFADRVARTAWTLAKVAAGACCIAAILTTVTCWAGFSVLDEPPWVVVGAMLAECVAAGIVLASPRCAWRDRGFISCVLALAAMPVLPIVASNTLAVELAPLLGVGAVLCIVLVCADRSVDQVIPRDESQPG